MRIDISFNCKEQFIPLNFKSYQQIVAHDVERYEGDYVVTPKIDSQVLHTKEKYMNDDVTVKGIPYFEVSNDSGNTVYIGKEIEINGN